MVPTLFFVPLLLELLNMLRTQLRKMSSVNYPQEFVNFLNVAHTPYHAVHCVKEHLTKHGFQELSERDSWNGKVLRKGKYFVTRNNSSIIAFVVGGKWAPGNPIAIVGAHTDSPTLRIKPNSKRDAEKYEQIGVEVYGGAIWHTWFDKDLSVAGRVMVNCKKSGKVVSKLLDLNKPLLKIPNLAIHLTDRTPDFKFNREQHLLPIAGLVKEEEKKKEGEEGKPNGQDEEAFSSLKPIVERHSKRLLELIVEELSLESVDDIEDFELILYDNNAACLGGMDQEFIFSGRLDNMTSTFTGMHGIALAAETGIEEETGIRMYASFDHEEIGSASAQGADSNFLPNIMERLTALKCDETDVTEPVGRSLILESSAKSFFLSSDVSHAVHPNYAGKYESKHRPIMGGGPVIKVNANQRYTTNAAGIALIKKMADNCRVPLQFFVVANDSPCGSTIGPILASKTGIRTLDIGNPILSMHSVRETGGAGDLELQIKLFKEFFETYSKLENQIVV